MYLKTKEEEFDTLTDGYTRIQCCTYLLQMMEQLQRMSPAFMEAYPLRDPSQTGA